MIFLRISPCILRTKGLTRTCLSNSIVVPNYVAYLTIPLRGTAPNTTEVERPVGLRETIGRGSMNDLQCRQIFCFIWLCYVI